MAINTLTTQAGFKIGPIVFETLIKHYFDRVKKDVEDGKTTRLRQEEFLYDQAFNVIKAFLEASTHHTVEEVQGFSNTRIPSPPWVRVVRLLVPPLCCEEAAGYLVQAFGGEEMARRVVGGVKWWQVRGINGVDGQWIAAKKDWREAKRRHKMQEKMKHAEPPHASGNAPLSQDQENGVYEEDLDEMRCILYSHGGGYYFGSVDQERYSIQRYARKINGRVFAINYRLAPQYPFPCALQDVLAAYLYLIRPPPGAAHRPVKPAHIVVAGDSAGGGLTLALLQVLRDTGLPLPAGGVLISPWCDLTHSFASCHTNTATDIIPTYGLSLQKPSSLWPPPSDELTTHVHASLRSRIRKALHMDDAAASASTPITPSGPLPSSCPSTPSGMPVDVGSTTPLAQSGPLDNHPITLLASNGETLVIDQQVHLYTPNNLLMHPLVSPALGYLGGLPPLFFIASDKEVLRDEIIYTAHKAANPAKHPVKEASRALYPPLVGIEERHQPTQVHLQVYDDAAHVLPVLFAFTTPGKFCFRAMATFCKHVTGMNQTPQSPIPSSPSIPTALLRASTLLRKNKKANSLASESSSVPTVTFDDAPSAPTQILDTPLVAAPEEMSSRPSLPQRRSSVRRSLTIQVTRATSMIRRRRERSASLNEEGSSSTGTGKTNGVGQAPGLPSIDAEDQPSSPTSLQMSPREAGEPSVYLNTIPESELDAFRVPEEIIGDLSERSMRRYLQGRAKFDQKFAGTMKSVDRDRKRQLERAARDPISNMKTINARLSRDGKALLDGNKGIKEGLLATSGTWTWAWLLEGKERPPPSSIAARRDTEEARRLARFADVPLQEGESSLSANNLWSVLLSALNSMSHKHKADPEDAQAETEKQEEKGLKRKLTVLSKFGLERRRTHAVKAETTR
ncbi:hypothetical protein HGRIS_002008 [Hohenbuehelia grisea]|uniref:Alpha/beta hydrolase fold-3 domain-containing protein n=1 Tax=Hohenbuehelia grisea TaxID=104357 RepID=A0ABR3JJ53_9AGAR